MAREFKNYADADAKIEVEKMTEIVESAASSSTKPTAPPPPGQLKRPLGLLGRTPGSWVLGPGWRARLISRPTLMPLPSCPFTALSIVESQATVSTRAKLSGKDEVDLGGRCTDECTSCYARYAGKSQHHHLCPPPVFFLVCGWWHASG